MRLNNLHAADVPYLAYRGDGRTWDVPEEPVETPRRRAMYLSVKSGCDWLVALGLFALALPLVLVLALLIKVTSRGPVIYRQTRLGRHGRPYAMFKLRTMVQNAEAQTGAVWAAKDDQRVTKLGKWLRALHLDELPQLWNVLRGEMSLIGPRPERPELAERIERDLPLYHERLEVSPGITGLAQMLAPADDPSVPLCTSVRKKLAHDLFYVREVSFLLDLRIAIATPCYFVAAAVESFRLGLLQSYGVDVAKEVPPEMTEEPETHRLELAPRSH